jgi:hypothetical protein
MGVMNGGSFEEVVLPTSKICTKCGEDKLFKCFYKLWSGKYGYMATCRLCLRRIHIAKIANKKLAENEKRKCSACKAVKITKLFYKRKKCGNRKAGYSYMCMECEKDKSLDNYYKRIGKKRPRKAKT